MNSKLAPIVLLVYNRPWHTRQVVEALQKNTLAKDSELFIFSDAPQNEATANKVYEVRKYLSGITGFKKIHISENEENIGGNLYIKPGVSEVIAKYGKVIIVEDDIVTAPFFLKYLNEALNVFENDEKIWSIAGYVPAFRIPSSYTEDIFLSPRFCSWGWGTWKDRWESIDWDKTGADIILKDSLARKSFCRGGEDLYNTLVKFPGIWDITVYYTQWKLNKMTVYPRYSLTKNIGTDGTGVHFKSKWTKYDVELQNKEIKIRSDILPNEKVLHEMKVFYRKKWYRKCMIFIAKKMGVYDFLQKRFG
jgi:hypothetical protein